MHFTILIVFSLISFAFANELSISFNAKDSTCTAQCSACSGISDDHANDDVPAAGTSGDMSCRNQSFFNAKSLKEVKAGMTSLSNDVKSLQSSAMATSEVVTDILNRLEELIAMYNESKHEVEPEKKVSEKKHIELKGVQYTRFWWFNDTAGYGWPSGETDVLRKSYGTCDEDKYYCFGRLPQTLDEASSELVAVDSAGNMYKWKFDPNNPTAHSAWGAFYSHVDQRIKNNQVWNPEVIKGSALAATQDSFMYRTQNGVRSVLLDDDTCDCYSTLSMGHGMCELGFSTSYGPEDRFGVDLLYDNGCSTPNPAYGLTLYFKDPVGN